MRLELSEITAGYGETVALREVTLVVPAGACVALIGPNGAGKTTLLSVASGLVRPRGGSYRLDGEDVGSLSTTELAHRGVCHIREGRSVFPGLSVLDNLRMFAPRGVPEAETIERVAASFPILGERMSQLAGTMSGGEQQMLALARAYAQPASLVMLDELSMGLAPIIVNEIFDFLSLLGKEGRSLLIVEQYIDKALAVADFVYLMVRGRMVFAGEPSELEGSDLLARYLGGEAAEPSGAR